MIIFDDGKGHVVERCEDGSYYISVGSGLGDLVVEMAEEIERLRELVKNSYDEGWNDSCTWCGSEFFSRDNNYAWDESTSKNSLFKKEPKCPEEK